MNNLPDYFSIEYEDDQILVVNKQAGVLTMGQAADEPSVLAAARLYLAQNHEIEDTFVAIVGRLDHPVSGLLVIAKDSRTADNLWQQIANKTLVKRYRALVHGNVKLDQTNLTNWIRKDRRHRSVSIVPENSEGAQFAQLSYQVEQRIGECTELLIELHTGRKHQIRAQLSHAGHAVVGDFKYGSKARFQSGIALTCCEIQLVHPERDEAIKWKITPPSAWKNWLDRVTTSEANGEQFT